MGEKNGKPTHQTQKWIPPWRFMIAMDDEPLVAVAVNRRPGRLLNDSILLNWQRHFRRRWSLPEGRPPPQEGRQAPLGGCWAFRKTLVIAGGPSATAYRTLRQCLEDVGHRPWGRGVPPRVPEASPWRRSALLGTLINYTQLVKTSDTDQLYTSLTSIICCIASSLSSQFLSLAKRWTRGTFAASFLMIFSNLWSYVTHILLIPI